MDATRWLDLLLAPRGRELVRRLASEPPIADGDVRAITRLRQQYPPDLLSAALTQARLRLKARSKFGNADRMYFTQHGLEQASSERMAAHHARRYEHFDFLADLCTGIGGDLIGLAVGRAVLAVDLVPVHARLARINADANAVGDNVHAVCADVRDLRLGGVRAAFIDPARRSDDRRFRTGVSEPPLAWCVTLADRVPAVGVKAAPALAVELVPAGWELEFVSERRELKEALLWSPALATTERRATVLPSRDALVRAPGPDVPIGTPGAYVLDPDPAVTRAGLVEELARSLGNCWKIDAQVAFLSADHALRTPFARTLRVEASMPWGLARLRDELRALGIGRVDVRKRGSAVDVDELQRRLKLSGDRGATVVLTRSSDRPWALVCTALGDD